MTTYHLYNSNLEILASIDTALSIDDATDDLVTSNVEAPEDDETFEFDCVSDHVTVITVRDETYVVAADGINIAAYFIAA